MSVNNKISEHLSKNGWTHATLADAIGTTRQYLSRLLKSKDIKLSQLEKICKALNVPVYYFFEIDSSKENQIKDDLKSEIAFLKNTIDSLNSDLSGEKKNRGNMDFFRKDIVIYLDETFIILFENIELFKAIKKVNQKEVVKCLRENIICRNENRYPFSKFKENIIYILKNASKLPLSEKKYKELFTYSN